MCSGRVALEYNYGLECLRPDTLTNRTIPYSKFYQVDQGANTTKAKLTRCRCCSFIVVFVDRKPRLLGIYVWMSAKYFHNKSTFGPLNTRQT